MKKQKSKTSKISLRIDDESLFKLHNASVLLAELKIQERIKLNGTKKESSRLLELISEFINS